MRLIDYIYAHIYGWYQKMVENGRKVDPQELAAMVFGICVNGWYMVFMQIYNSISRVHKIAPNLMVNVLIGLLFSGIVNMLYSRKDRYLIVYNRFRQSETVKYRKRSTVFSWIFIFLPYILLLFSLFL